MRRFLKTLAWVSPAVVPLVSIAYCKNIRNGSNDQDEQTATVNTE